MTRLLADGLRLFAAAIPVKVMLWAVRINASYWQIVLVLALLTVIYTLTGGIRAVVWIDAIQLCIYLGGALLTALILSDRLPTGWFATAWHDGKLQLFDFTSPILTQQYSFVAALVGGAVFAMASHGADQLMVQRLLSCRSLRDSQLAVIASGVVVLLQSGLFLLIGTMLWSSMSGASPASLGLTSNDELFPQFIVTHLPPGLTGLLLAGILSAAMSTLSGSLNSLSSSTVSDLARRLMPGKVDDSRLLRYGKLWTLLWAVAFVLFASLFSSTKSPVVELGLSIASYTYGALLGAFLLGLLVKRAQQSDAIVAFVSTLAGVLYLAVWVAIPDGNGGSSRLAFPWYAPIGVAISLAVGGMLSLRHARPALEVSTTASAETP
jgi:Na+/proline symporter